MTKPISSALLPLVLLATACGPAADGEEGAAQEVAAPTAAPSEVAASPESEATSEAEPLIPAKFQGEWGEVDDSHRCAPDGSNVMRVTADTLVYSTGTVQITGAEEIDADTLAITGRYGEDGQAPTKDVSHQLKLANGGNTLSEIFDGMAPFDYNRC